jgi:hypothetical protein
MNVVDVSVVEKPSLPAAGIRDAPWPVDDENLGG